MLVQSTLAVIATAVVSYFIGRSVGRSEQAESMRDLSVRSFLDVIDGLTESMQRAGITEDQFKAINRYLTKAAREKGFDV